MTAELADLARINAAAPFNRWAGFAVESSGPGRCVLGLVWRPELGQYAGLLHAGVASAMLETCCGFAAYSEIGPNLVTQMSVSYVASARGKRFRGEGRLVRGGRRQSFAQAELFALSGDSVTLVATAAIVLVTTAAPVRA